jgi:4-amino-4-deoxy-L-arabinose transferase-like glycosyltransferase
MPERGRWAAIVLMLAVVLLFAGVRWRLRTMPLERDEGEYAYAGQLILQGIPPYQIAYNLKLPGTYLAYAAILRTFGETATGIHLGLILVNGCATLLMFFLARRLYGDLAGVAAASSYGLLSTSEAVLGLAGHATHFVALMALAGLLILLAARRSKNVSAYFAAGICMGLAFLMKQPGAVFVLLGAQLLALDVWKDLAERKKLPQRLGVYGAGAAIPYLLTCVWLYRAGVFAKFWFWTISYASQYGTSTGILQGLKYLIDIVPQLFYGAPVVWCFAAIGLFALIRERGRGAVFGFEIRLLAWSFVGVSAGLYYRDHYFILLLPAVCLLAGFAVKWCADEMARRSAVSRLSLASPLVFAIGFALSLFAQRAICFELQPDVVSRVVYGGSPFPEAVEFAKYIQEHSDANAKVAVLGSEPEIYFYSQRHSATGYIYTYGLMEEQKYASRMQQEMIGEIVKERPEYLVKVMIPGSWLRKTNSDTTILYWADKYIGEEYRIVGVVEIGAATNYRWDQDAVGYVPRSKYSVYLYKRKI